MPAAIRMKRSRLFATIGFCLGLGAPVVWTIIRLLFFRDPAVPVAAQILGDIFKNTYNITLYCFMGIGTALVMAILGYSMGRAGDELQERAMELDRLHREVADQKQLFENRYKVLDNNIKNFHHIASRIQKSLDWREVLQLCAEGLHEVLGYERVNILYLDPQGASLQFVAATGSPGFDTGSVALPLDHRSGVLYKCFNEKQLFLVDDIARFPSEFHLQPPFDGIQPLRSRSFVVAPIVVKGESVGLFGIDNKFSHRSLNDTDVDTVRLFADQAASAIMRIQLLNAIDVLAHELEKSFLAVLDNREIYTRNVAGLRRSIETLAAGTSAIVAASERVMSAVEETGSAAEQISGTIDEVTQNVDFLAQGVEKSVTAMEEIHTSIRNVEQNAVVSHEVSSRVKLEADRGLGVVGETIEALAAIQSGVDRTYEAIKRLSDNSGRIETIVTTINEITRKTNLLALNASIIAAQAGEYGKSFSVVADEIRNLSLQTGRSTGEITAIVGEILEESQASAKNVTYSREMVARGVEFGNMMVEALEVINESAAKSMIMTQEIKVATAEQASSVTFVTRSMEDISAMTSHISSAVREEINGVRSIVKAITAIEDLSREMVESTSRQARSREEISAALDAVSAMIQQIFDEMQLQRNRSAGVLVDLNLVRKAGH